LLGSIWPGIIAKNGGRGAFGLSAVRKWIVFDLEQRCVCGQIFKFGKIMYYIIMLWQAQSAGGVDPSPGFSGPGPRFSDSGGFSWLPASLPI